MIITAQEQISTYHDNIKRRELQILNLEHKIQTLRQEIDDIKRKRSEFK